ncbi:MAG: quinone oxidoreductase [Gammaproteobacteria bacterium]|nr:MAG: quinone oxidoreductase [Gammaproteobacteria bacterium]
MDNAGFVFCRHGGPEVLEWCTWQDPPPGPGQVRVRHEAVGVNFIDLYHLRGLYPLPLPARLGYEAAGRVEAVGPGVAGFEPGMRVGYAHGALGAYALANTVPAEQLLPLPETLDAATAAAVLLKGLTAAYLLDHSHPLAAGETILVHAAAGGVGRLLCQWAAARGARVIGTVGDPAKAALARADGCAAVLCYRDEPVVERVLELTGGEGVHAVYDGVGQATFDTSLACLRVFGTLVSFGNASGPVPPVAPLRLAEKSLFLTRPTLAHHVRPRERLLARAGALFRALADGAVHARIGGRFALREAPAALAALAERRSTGALVLEVRE